ncbi:MAG TPA: GGDEF domain-containing protein [Burkholderiales bacterium]|jgi:diguanylate cyclase (GGDEF)-like protein|nr:GGDEF domain-containing protein [Burkholderiales bacterium]
MLTRTSLALAIEQDELKGFARTIAEIEWLLLILVLLYLLAGGPKEEGRIAIHMGLFFLGAFILALHYVQFYRRESRAKLAVETWVMIVFITWVVTYSGRIESPLLNLYLLPIIASSLILGKLMTAIAVAAIALCYMALAYDPQRADFSALTYWGSLLALVAPVILVAYITTMLAADIRYAVDKIKQVSDTDDLTGLYNMRAFSSILQRTFKQSVRHGHPLSVVMIDSDNLKAINDAHGHETGNRLLQHLVRCIRDELRGSDVMARFGGDEFVILLPETNRHGAQEMAERIRKSIESSRFDVRGGDTNVTVSIGIASYPEDGGNLEVILDKADKAMYRAKQRGRNQVALYATEEIS